MDIKIGKAYIYTVESIAGSDSISNRFSAIVVVEEISRGSLQYN